MHTCAGRKLYYGEELVAEDLTCSVYKEPAPSPHFDGGWGGSFYVPREADLESDRYRRAEFTLEDADGRRGVILIHQTNRQQLHCEFVGTGEYPFDK